MSEERLTVVLSLQTSELQLLYDMASELYLGRSGPQNVSKCGWTVGDIEAKIVSFFTFPYLAGASCIMHHV